MFLEMHVVQNFALSNLNRDDTGAPKSCIFGGTRRARISSQCLKRAVRTYFREEALIPSELLSYRTKWLHREVINRLADSGIDPESASQIATNALGLMDLKLKKGKTEYLLLLGEQEIAKIAAVCREHSEDLLAINGEKRSKQDKDSNIQIAKQLLAVIDGGDAIDLALFGRMVANHPEKSVDAAVQMAHAFSTHAVATEFDYYTAVEELKDGNDDEGAGAGMLGTTLYNSSCYYRYANLDLNQLEKNLGGKRDHLKTAICAFMVGFIHAVPSGKNTNSAPQNPPAFIMVTLRDSGLWSLANAFVRPIYPNAKGDITEQSSNRLLEYWNQLANLYGMDGICYAGFATYLPITDSIVEASNMLTQAANVSDLQDEVMNKIARSWN